MLQEEETYFKRGPRILNDHFVIDPNEFTLWNLSYSMHGEDLVLRTLLKSKLRAGIPGFYVDLGSFDSRYGSNSYLFYRYGWRGVCVDANPRVTEQYPVCRPRDVFLNAAVGEPGVGYWAESSVPGASRVVRFREEVDPECTEVTEIAFLPLKTIFDAHVPPGTDIDFMSVDIEGGELSALRSNDWSRYRPKIILIETWNIDAMNIDASETLSYLRNLNYKVEGVMFPNALLTAN